MSTYREHPVGHNVWVESERRTLNDHGFAWIDADVGTLDEAFEVARALIDMGCPADGLGPPAIIGDFVIPPIDGGQTRDFQTLHFDFGVPVDPRAAHDVARYTALHIPHRAVGVSAVTRLVPLVALLRQRAWPALTELLRRLIDYGRTHGAWDDTEGYVEGSLARLVEAADSSSPHLPSVKVQPDFLCGMEFDTLRAEVAFFERHGLDVDSVQIEIALRPGGLLVFDNLALAHGRRGTRQPGELRQRVFGDARLGPAAQRGIRDRVLNAFGVGC